MASCAYTAVAMASISLTYVTVSRCVFCVSVDVSQRAAAVRHRENLLDRERHLRWCLYSIRAYTCVETCVGCEHSAQRTSSTLSYPVVLATP